MATDEQNPAKGHILQIYKYLQALDQLRNPVIRNIKDQPWSIYFQDLPNYLTIEKGQFENDFSDSGISSASSPFILKIQRPVLTDAPQPPSSYLSVLKDTWKKPELRVRLNLDKITGEEDEEELTEEQLLANYSEDEEFAQWLKSRELWAEKEVPARQAMEIYNKFYELYARLEREAEQYELVLGEGHLYWNYQSGLISHPILLQRLRLDFDPAVPEFSLSETEHSVELYTALFRTVSEVTGTVMSRLQEELEQTPYHPLGGQDTAEYLKRIVTQLSPYGQILGPDEKAAQNDAPRIVRDPLVFLRKRSLGFSKAIEEILKDIPERVSLPSFLENVVGLDSETEPSTPEDALKSIDPNGEDEEVLLSKLANSEQLQIANRLKRYNAVLVQGPPGTGKTHSIANLIGHFLAQGKSVLVTSHTSKALSVLHEKIVTPLQPLCLSVLTDNNRQQLESSVDAITERLANSDPEQLEREAKVLQQERVALLKELRETRQKLLFARADEYRPIVIAGNEYAPAQAARTVREDQERCSWLSSPIRLGVSLPLAEGELVELYQTNLLLTHDDEQELEYPLPDPQQLPAPYEFEEWVKTVDKLASMDLEEGKEYWQTEPENEPEKLETILNQIQKAIQIFEKASKWELALIDARMQGEEQIAPWQNLITQIEGAYTQSLQAQETLLNYAPSVSEDCLPHELDSVLDEIIAHISAGGSLGVFKLLTKGSWKTLINQAQVNGSSPQRLEQFEAIKVFVDLRNTRKRLSDRWERQVAVLGGPKASELGNEPELVCHSYIPLIRNALNWHPQQWTPLVEQLQKTGFRWQDFYDKTAIQLGEQREVLRLKKAITEELAKLVEIQTCRLKLKGMEEKIRALKLQLEQGGSSTAQVTSQLLMALQGKKPEDYRQGYQRLVDLKNLKPTLQLRQDLLKRLEQDAPAWAAAISGRQGIHGEGQLPGNPSEAWLWRQFADELEDRVKKSMEELLKQITHLSQQLREKTSILVEKKAWAAQVRRTTVSQRLALNGWKQLMHRIGKGTGKRVPELRAEARKLMPLCQSAVPVWIMPLSRVVENFNPRTNRFDIVVIDEASQADVLALTALYMGKQVVVVGDNEQVSPSAVGQNVEEANKLIEEHLQGVPNAKLYDGLLSIYDLADTAFQPICLREHFRCVSPIIQFSNYLSYEGKIKPLRDESTVKVRPHTVAYRVEGSQSAKKVNEKEAQVVASLLIACTEQPEYQDATFGVISLVGEEQAVVIDRLLQNYLSAGEYKRCRIQCGNPAQFQGDERDIIFLSMVDASSGEGPLSKRGEGAHETFKKRYNVAASRARDQMWVVYSLDPENDLKPNDIRGELIKHAKDPQAVLRMLDTADVETESEFEKQVLFRLRQAGYTVYPQWKVGGYRIDMVIEGKGKRVALECDGDRWHTLENLNEDMSRQAILERLGWRFIRIRGSEFFRDPDSTMAAVFARIKDYEIYPENKGIEEIVSESQAEGLKDLIIRRAEVLRRIWNGEDEDDQDTDKHIDKGEGHSISLDVKDVVLANEDEKVISQAAELLKGEEISTVQEGAILQENNLVNEMDREKSVKLGNPSGSDYQQSYDQKAAVESAEPLEQNAVLQESQNPSSRQAREVEEEPFRLEEFLIEHGFEWVDNRKIGGTIWVIGNEELAGMMEKFRAQGFRFRYKPHGGRMTKNRSAWYLSE
ncbi:AAA domain-containing protein [Desulfosporosinus sp. FKA]|uniref:AAA domain-containing protein n=1 Tax=Desulfosporosinus sp. FKA TaxID=1969834 RepID=UPI000B4A4BA3|nr:AAA domain-containing protein [Desulfosporosinus sp. FKA]